MQTERASIRQSPLLIGLTGEQLDHLPRAVAKLDRRGVFSYGNRAMCEIAGVASIEGRSIEDMFRGGDLATVREHLESRFTRGAADDYEVVATRASDGVLVPIHVSAMPDIDDAGQVVGAIAMVSDLLAQDVAAKVTAAVQDLRGCDEILGTVARECGRLVRFDAFSVSIYSTDGSHAKTVYMHPEGMIDPSVRWYEMTGYARSLINAKQVINIADLASWLNQPECLVFREERDMQIALEMGFRSSLSVPVVSGNCVVASIGFGRKQDKPPFDQSDEERLGRLPLGAAVRMALHYQDVEELKFALDLIRKIAAGPDNTVLIAETLIGEIAQHYKWQNVSIFRADEPKSRLCLVRQKANKESFLLPEGWSHPIDRGITGRVFRTREALNVPDVDAPELKGEYLPVYRESRSELCIPILVDGRVYWILNIEDSQRNAFAREEQQALENVLREVAVVLDLVSKTLVFGELLERSKDAIIQTDLRGVIVQTNPATQELLGYGEAEMKGQSFADYFLDGDQARRVRESKYVPNDEIQLRHKDGAKVRLLLSGTSLPQEIGLKIYVCNDLSTRKRLETLEILRHMYNEIASQIKTPLSLAFSWLSKLQTLLPEGPAADILAKTVKQLNKVDLTYDRLLMYERHRSIAPLEKCLFEITALLADILRGMPDSDASRIEITAAQEIPRLRGDVYQLGFCFESLLAYLLRFLPDGEKVTAGIESRDGAVAVTIRGYAPRITGGALIDFARTRWAIHAITETALGEEMIRGFIEKNHGGRLRKQRGSDGRMEFVVELPAGEAEGAR
jgi:PAS domain S-box-containing protein